MTLALSAAWTVLVVVAFFVGRSQGERYTLEAVNQFLTRNGVSPIRIKARRGSSR